MKISPEGPYRQGQEPQADDELQEPVEVGASVTDLAAFRLSRLQRKIAARTRLFGYTSDDISDTDPWPDGA